MKQWLKIDLSNHNILVSFTPHISLLDIKYLSDERRKTNTQTRLY